MFEGRGKITVLNRLDGGNDLGGAGFQREGGSVELEARVRAEVWVSRPW